jgi:glycosyltransferase involved in cell wall biosynthesis
VKVLNLIQCTNLGGMEQASLRLMRGLMQRGEKLELLSLNPVGQLGPLLENAKIPHEGLPYLGKGGWRSYGLLRKKLKETRADGMLMTGHHLLASLALGDFCKGHRILTIHYHHGGVKSQWQWQLIYRIACQRFNVITFPCDFIRKEAEAIFPPVARVAHTVRYQLDIPPLPTANEKTEARKFLNLPLDHPVIGNAGWLIPRKRFDIFLRTARKILDKNPNVFFAIAGSGEEQANLKKLADELGIAANVHWLGWQQEMSHFYKSLDIMLFNSDWDALGLTPLEAMSYGVPAICSVVNGGLSEIIDSEEVGFLLPTHDIDALANRALHLLSHPDEAAAIGLAGRAHIETVCRPEPIVDWYAEALSGRIPSQKHKFKGAALPGKKRTALLFHRVGPYHFARARAAGKLIDTKLIEVFKSDDVYGWDPVPGADGFERVTLFENNSQAKAQLIGGVQAALNEYKPDVVAIPGWADAVAFSAIQWCGDNRVPVIVMSETTAWDESRIVWKERIKRHILKMCSAGLVGGHPHAEYLVRLGMSRENIFQGYDAVDNEYFSRKTSEAKNREPEIRKKYGLPENYFLASARFVDKKNLLNLIRAYALYRKLVEKNGTPPGKTEIWHLVLLGDGPLKSALSDLIASLGLQKFVLLPGFKQYDELPAFYALARAFIHCSTVEQWGLVVNEAMASGLPVLVSNRCGCAQNLVQEGVNGFTFDPYDVKQMAEVMARISAPKFPISDFGAASTRIIADWSPDRFAEGLSQAVGTALSASPHPLGAFDRLLLQLLSRK